MKTIFFLNLKSSLKDMYLLFWSIFMPCTAIIALKIFLPNLAGNYTQGMIAVSVFFYTFMTTSFIALSQRRRGVFHLLHATPLPLWKYIVSVSSSWALIAIILSYIILLFSIVVHQLTITLSSLFYLIPVILTASLAFVFLSFFVSSLVKNEGHLSMTANIIMLPMLLCSNAFLTMEKAPNIVQFISRINPFEWFLRGIQGAFYHNYHLWGESILLLLLCLAFSLLISIKTFKYSDQ
ncbi:ABC transporter permease [Lysinibacillus pakistanensis]|uniref:Transport permease protein n=1 Tax=Lysinibacillus pakistanensis TaxID=759811 RepID=A0AAX3WNY6_9BACI|nr:ABC transporter permease [Lysinibacillus pakistanensis]MDM5233870.1 ABC transporter permease [Lysinibacillus pakistanensis]WHY44483.1 ABC transporter permease [Lysinibacillus pakistanensis]WHY49491.1 ABC transporter permease [Lysinibacillus pakistanensis]